MAPVISRCKLPTDIQSLSIIKRDKSLISLINYHHSLTKSISRKNHCGTAVSAVETGETPVPLSMILYAYLEYLTIDRDPLLARIIHRLLAGATV